MGLERIPGGGWAYEMSADVLERRAIGSTISSALAGLPLKIGDGVPVTVNVQRGSEQRAIDLIKQFKTAGRLRRVGPISSLLLEDTQLVRIRFDVRRFRVLLPLGVVLGAEYLFFRSSRSEPA